MRIRRRILVRLIVVKRTTTQNTLTSSIRHMRMAIGAFINGRE